MSINDKYYVINTDSNRRPVVSRLVVKLVAIDGYDKLDEGLLNQYIGRNEVVNVGFDIVDKIMYRKYVLTELGAYSLRSQPKVSKQSVDNLIKNSNLTEYNVSSPKNVPSRMV